jgi:GNAT superfamily N-acetyltransferase
MARKFIGLSVADREALPSRCVGCVFWESAERLPLECGSRCSDEQATEWVRMVAAEWGECGKVVTQDGEYLGFIKYAPPRFVPQARNMPAGMPLPDAPLITCLHIEADARRHGLGGVLLREALRDLASRNEKTVQAYALARRVDLDLAPMVGVEFLLRSGFVVERPHPEVPLLRLDLKSLVSWADNVESVLDSLRLPVRVPKRAPVTLMHSGKCR